MAVDRLKLAATEGRPATDVAFEWTDSRYDTRVVLERAKQLRDGEFALTCVWMASRIRSSPHIDHSFPAARWQNKDLWNLLPVRGNINLSKSNRLASSDVMVNARMRLLYRNRDYPQRMGGQCPGGIKSGHRLNRWTSSRTSDHSARVSGWPSGRYPRPGIPVSCETTSALM